MPAPCQRAPTPVVAEHRALGVGIGAGVAAAETAASPGSASAGQGVEPGPDHTDFQPGPDYTDLEPGPDYSAFEPGAAPSTADLVDDDATRLLTSVFRGLFG